MTRLVAAAAGLLVLLPAGVRAEQVLTLDQAIANAMTRNPQIVGARDTVSAAGNKVLEARAGYLPSATAALAYKRMTMNSAAVPNTGPAPADATIAAIMKASTSEKEASDSFNNYTASLTVSQTIYDFGRTGGSFDASKAGVTSAEADLKTARDAVFIAVVQAYFNVLAMQETVSVAAETKKQMEKHLELAQAQLASGVRTRIDVTRAQSDLAAANLSVVKADNALAVARVNLNNAMGVPDPGPYRVARASAAGVDEPPAVGSAVQEALERRPEYRSMKEKIRALEATLVVAKSAYYPVIAAAGNLTYGGYDLGGLVYNWSIGATATWNFFSGFNTENAVQETTANIRVLQSGIAALDLAIRLEIESAIYGYREARESMAPSRALVASAKETLDLSEARYAAGAGNIVEVTDAQTVYTQARAGLIQAEFNLEVARARLQKAIGQVTLAKDGE